MPTLLIAYDLAHTNPVAPALAAAIKALGTQWARPLAALWYVETDRSPAQVETLLSDLLEIDDGLLVQQVTGAAALVNTMLRWTPVHPVAHGVGGRVIPWPNSAPRQAEAA